jgi:hypothetical protein
MIIEYDTKKWKVVVLRSSDSYYWSIQFGWTKLSNWCYMFTQFEWVGDKHPRIASALDTLRFKFEKLEHITGKCGAWCAHCYHEACQVKEKA